MENKIATATSNAVAKKEKSIKDYVVLYKEQIAAALPAVMTPERFSRIVTSALSTTPKLNECTPKSFLGAMLTAAQLGLEPNTPLGQAYLIPYKNKGVDECQFQIGYKGLIDLAYRSGEISVIQAQTVYENDDFVVEYGLEPKLSHKPAKGNRGQAIAYYAMFRTKDGGFGFEVMNKADIEAHARKYSKSYGSGYSSPWTTNFDEMAKKTVLKRVLKYAPLKSEFLRAVGTDETIKSSMSAEMMDEPDETVADAEYTVVDTVTGEIKEN